MIQESSDLRPFGSRAITTTMRQRRIDAGRVQISEQQVQVRKGRCE